MAITENGATALFAPPATYFTSPGTGGKIRVANPNVRVIFEHIATRWHNEIEPITQHQGWRLATKIRGTNLWSNHCSGYAMDINWSKHPYERTVLANGRRYPGHGFTRAGLATLHEIRDQVNDFAGERLIRLGVDYNTVWGMRNREDGMHVECGPGFTEAGVVRSAAGILALQSHRVPTPAGGEWADGVLKSGDRGADVRSLQEFFLAVYPSYVTTRAMRAGYGADGVFGSELRAVVAEFQRRVGLHADGVVGRATLAALARPGLGGWKPENR